MTVEKLLEGCEHDGSYIPVGEVKRLMKEYARIKCLEAIKNTREKAVDIVENIYDPYTPDYNWSNPVIREIQNIPNQDVMPEL